MSAQVQEDRYRRLLNRGVSGFAVGEHVQWEILAWLPLEYQGSKGIITYK